VLAWEILAIALAFGVTVFVHEAGHFVGARLCGMAVYEFSIGFGRPLLFWFRRGDTQYSFRLWPFFSYVRIAGMEPGDDHPAGFDKKNRLAQAFVLVLGCLMNFLLGVAIFIFIGVAIGKFVGVSPTIERVMPGTVAAKHGLLAGDRLIGYSGRTNLPLEEIQAAIQSRVEKPITLEIDRHGEHLSVPLTTEKAMVPEMDKKGLTYRAIGRIGIIFEKRTERMGIRESVTSGFVATYQMTKLLVVYLYAVMGRKMPLVLMGPVGVVHQMYQDVKVSWEGFLATAAALTVGLGFLNLLPIPPLDGSRLLITGLEAIRRKPFDKRKEVVVHLVGFALLLVLVVVLTYSDILRIVKLGGG
jgi:regulator of sigma E protease